jgi:hypothetical protein
MPASYHILHNLSHPTRPLSKQRLMLSRATRVCRRVPQRDRLRSSAREARRDRILCREPRRFARARDLSISPWELVWARAGGGCEADWAAMGR